MVYTSAMSVSGVGVDEIYIAYLFDHVDTYDKQRSLRSNQNDNKFE
jgi:hypothetical protein